jgi:hypothetical protein
MQTIYGKMAPNTMEKRQETAVNHGAAVFKREPGTEKKLVSVPPEGVPSLGEKHVESMMALAKVAKLGEEDFKGMLKHLPLYKVVVDQMWFVKLNNLDQKLTKEQIKQAFRANEEDLKDEMRVNDGENDAYDYDDGWLVRDEDCDEGEVDVATKKKRFRPTPDALDIAGYQRKFRKYKKLLQKHAPVSSGKHVGPYSSSYKKVGKYE